MEYMIIGTGIAAISFLKEILKNRQDNMEITVFTKDEYSFYWWGCIFDGTRSD